MSKSEITIISLRANFKQTTIGRKRQLIKDTCFTGSEICDVRCCVLLLAFLLML